MSNEQQAGMADWRDLTRREVLGALALGLPVGAAVAGGEPRLRAGPSPAIAALVTEYRKASHGQGIVDRFLDGYGWQGRHHRPPVDVVALYVDQKPKGDLSQERVSRHPGSDDLSHDRRGPDHGEPESWPSMASCSIGEHGRLSPQCPRPDPVSALRVLPADRRGLPPLRPIVRRCSTISTCRGTGTGPRRWSRPPARWVFRFMAGSSLPVTWRIPAIDLPWASGCQEAVCVGYGGIDSYDFHGLETLQCMVERRRGGESGVTAVQAVRGSAVWDALAERLRGAARPARAARSVSLPQLHPDLAPARIRHVLPELAQMPGWFTTR